MRIYCTVGFKFYKYMVDYFICQFPPNKVHSIFEPYNSNILTWFCHVHRRPALMHDILLLLFLFHLDPFQHLHTPAGPLSWSPTMNMIVEVPNLLSLHLGLKVSLMQFFLVALGLTSVVHRVSLHIMSHSQQVLRNLHQQPMNRRTRLSQADRQVPQQ